jgi:hypothetical protein
LSLLLALTGGGGASYTLDCEAGAYVISGQDATLNGVFSLDCEAGSYSLAGQDATLTGAFSLDCEAGSYALTGQDLSFDYVPAGGTAYTLDCDAGAYTIDGQELSFDYVSTQTGAGKRRRVLLDVRGKIHEFETEEGANAFLASLEKVEEKTIEAKAKRIVKTISRTGNAFVPQPLKPIVVVEGTEQIAALVNMRLAMNQSMLNAAVQRELLEEQKRDDEIMAVMLMMMED